MKHIITLAFLLAAIASVAHAEEHSETYVGISASKLTNGHSSTGAGLTLGHRYNEHFGAEIAYEDSGALSAGHDRTTAVSASVLGYIPIYENWDIYGRLGYASAHSKDDLGASANRNDATYGAGVEYSLSEKYSLGLGWNHLRVGDDVGIPLANENSYALTLLFKF